MTYGRRHYLTQQVLVRLAYAGPTQQRDARISEGLRALRSRHHPDLLGLAAVRAAPSCAQDPGRRLPNAATTGEFLYRSGTDAALQVAPTVDTRVRFDVTGVIARATVVQRFQESR